MRLGQGYPLAPRGRFAAAELSVLSPMVRVSQAERSVAAMAPNRYAGACKTCGDTVSAEGGELRRETDSWAVYHTSCLPAPACVGPVCEQVGEINRCECDLLHTGSQPEEPRFPTGISSIANHRGPDRRIVKMRPIGSRG